MMSRNSIGLLYYGHDDIFFGVDPYLETEEFGAMLELLKGFPVNNQTLEDRIMAIRTIITPIQLASGYMVKEYRLYTIIRVALVSSYGIERKVDLPNGLPV